MRALVEKNTDISFIRLRPDADDFASELAWREDVVVAMSSIHRLAGRKRMLLKDLRDEEYVALAPESSEFAASIRDCCVAAGFLPRVAHEVVDAQSITGLLAAGFGVALVPSSIARFTTGEIKLLARSARPRQPPTSTWSPARTTSRPCCARSWRLRATFFSRRRTEARG